MGQHPKFHRTAAHQFSIQLDRHVFGTAHTQAASLKIFHLPRGDIGSKNDVLQILDQLEVSEILEDEDIEQTVIDDRVFEKREWTAIKAPIANQDEGSFFRSRVLRFDRQPRWATASNLRG